MRKLNSLFLFVMLALQAGAQNPYERFTEGLPFEMAPVKAPVFPATTTVLTQHGAKGDGTTLCTEAFAKAFDYLSERGGGHLVVPRGIWLTGPIVLSSNIDLHLDMVAVVLFAADESLYPLVSTSFEGLDTRHCQSPISGVGLENVAITGHGVIDGNGQYWRPLKKSKVTDSQWRALTSRPGGVELKKGYWVPSEGYAKGEASADMNVPKHLQDEAEWESIKRFLRPVMVSLVGCRNVLLQDVIFQNSPAWNLHPLMCENIIIDVCWPATRPMRRMVMPSTSSRAAMRSSSTRSLMPATTASASRAARMPTADGVPAPAKTSSSTAVPSLPVMAVSSWAAR